MAVRSTTPVPPELDEYDDSPLFARRVPLGIPSTFDPSMFVLQCGTFLSIAAVALLFFLVNGAYSVIGLKVSAEALGPFGVGYWRIVTGWTFTFPVPLPEVERAQPVIPWVLVVGSSALQVGLIWRRLAQRAIPFGTLVLGIVASAYDVYTTFSGLGTIDWIASRGLWLQVPLAFFFCFGLESAIGAWLRNIVRPANAPEEENEHAYNDDPRDVHASGVRGAATVVPVARDPGYHRPERGPRDRRAQ